MALKTHIGIQNKNMLLFAAYAAFAWLPASVFAHILFAHAVKPEKSS